MRAAEALTARIEAASGLDGAAAKLSSFWSAALKPAALRDVLSGTPIGHPLHPAAVLLPSGALFSASLLDAAGGAAARPAARLLVAAGLLSSVPAVLAGWSDWVDTEQAEKRVGLVHAASNVLGVSAYGASWLQRRRGGAGHVTGWLGAGFLGLGGWLGGHLAYAQGVGVDTTAFQTGPADWTDAAAAGDVAGGLTRVDLDGVALLLTRVRGRAVCIADRCTHRGAPLSDGERSGDCVVCPWHGSEFALDTGAVERGPATRPQPVYETREFDGRLQVRRREQRALRVNPTGG